MFLNKWLNVTVLLLEGQFVCVEVALYIQENHELLLLLLLVVVVVVVVMVVVVVVVVMLMMVW